jgi:hypothetical protein
MNWQSDSYRFHELLINGFVVATINGGLAKVELWRGTIFLPTRPKKEWKTIEDADLEKVKSKIELNVEKIMSQLTAPTK